MTDQRKIVCHASGPRCHGCPHYWGDADECKFAPVDDQRKKALEALEVISQTVYDETGPYTMAEILPNEIKTIRQALTEPVPDAMRLLREAREHMDTVSCEPNVYDDPLLGDTARDIDRALAQQGEREHYPFITPCMERAGAAVLDETDHGLTSSTVARKVYMAMHDAAHPDGPDSGEGDD